MWRKLVKRALAKLGYELRRRPIEGWQPRNLRKLGLAPRTLVDVGVAEGTPALYDAFPEAFLVLMEPLVEYERQSREILRHRPGVYLPTAVGDRHGRATMTVEASRLAKSSFLERKPLTATAGPATQREVPMTTLDAVAEEYRHEPPYGLKIDTEGFELKVVLGGTRFLEDTQFIIAEVSVAERFTAGYTLSEFIGTLDSRGFRLVDILRTKRSAEISGLVFLDAFFTRK